MKKPFLFALLAALYIVNIVLAISFFSVMMPEDTIIVPMAMLGLFVFSVAVMGFLFFYEPLRLFLEGKKREAVVFFAKMLGIFACFVIIFIALLFII